MKRGKKRRYAGRTFIRERIVTAGDRMEIAVYPVFQPPGVRRSKSRPTRAIQKRINERNSVNQGVRLAEANFGSGDYALHLTYSEEPESAKDAQKDLGNFIARLRRLYKRMSKELRYMKRTERGKTSGRLHHHMLIPGGVDRDEIEALWGKGRANTVRVQPDRDGIEGLARYIAGEGKKNVTYRRWSCSRNCVRPSVAEYDGRMDMEAAEAVGEAAGAGLGYELFERLYPGWSCVSCEGIKNGTNRGWYTYAVLRRRC